MFQSTNQVKMVEFSETCRWVRPHVFQRSASFLNAEGIRYTLHASNSRKNEKNIGPPQPSGSFKISLYPFNRSICSDVLNKWSKPRKRGKMIWSKTTLGVTSLFQNLDPFSRLGKGQGQAWNANQMSFRFQTLRFDSEHFHQKLRWSTSPLHVL